MAKKINPKQEIRKALKFCESSQFSDAISTLLMILEKYHQDGTKFGVKN